MKTMRKGENNSQSLAGFCRFLAAAVLVLSALSVLSFGGCSMEGEGPGAANKVDNVTIVSWNVENLFDGSDNGFEYDEFKSSAGWTNEKYQARLNGIRGVIDDQLKPDILCLIEVENQRVLEDLVKLLKTDYPWSFFAGAPGSSVGLGLLSRFPFSEAQVHSIYFSEGSLPRPVAEVRVETGSGPLVILAGHWKSKLGGAEETEQMRRAEAGIIARRIGEIAAEDPAIPVIVLGDLNECHDEFEKIDSAYVCALLPDTPEAAAMVAAAKASGTANDTEAVKDAKASKAAGSARAARTARASDSALALSGALRPDFQDYLIISGEKPPRTKFFDNAKGVVYSPWLEYPDSQGSYYYRYGWETIDHFLLNTALFDNNGWEYESFGVAAEPPLITAGGRPNAYNPKTGNGFSDHLPIVLCLGNVEERE